VTLEAIAPNGKRKNITDLAGFLGEDSNALAILLAERKHAT